MRTPCEAAAQLGDTLLDSCPRLRVLATSREPLVSRAKSSGKCPPPLTGHDGWRDTVEGLSRCKRSLFVDRARLRLPDRAHEENAGAVARVCRKLDGIPLAIELATARMGALAVGGTEARSLPRSVSGGSRTAAPRQRTLRATLDWSHDLLSGAERGVQDAPVRR